MPPKRLKIAIDSTFMDRRPAKGTAIVIRDNVNELLSRPEIFEVTLIHREKIPEDPTYSKALEIIIPKIPTPKWSGWISELFFFLRTKERFDIYYFPYSRLYPTFWLAPAKKIVWAAMDGGPSTSGYKGDAKGKAPWYTRIFLRYVDAIIAISQFGKDGIVQTYGISPSRVHVVYDSLGEVFLKTINANEAVLSKYNLTKPYILDVSRFDPHKNILRLIRAYHALVTKHNIPHSLVFVGGRHMPDYSAEVDALIKECNLEDKIIVTPFIADEDMPSIYAHAECMIFPSLYEGFGLPVIEAMAMRTPVVISDIDALLEVSGGFAEVVNPYNTDSIAKGILQTLDMKDTFQMEDRIEKAHNHALSFSRKAHGDSLTDALLAA